MAQPQELRAPRTDDRPLWDVVLGIIGYPAMLVAHQLRLFAALADGPLDPGQLAGALGIEVRPASALLTVCSSLGLLRVEDDGRYGLTPVAEDYLLETSPTYFGDYLDGLVIDHNSLYSVESVKAAVLSNRPQVYGGDELFQSHEKQEALARAFTLMMHGHSIGPALEWPDAVDLSGDAVLLDVGGGSGAHAIGAARRWPHLEAIVMDLGPVCKVADEMIARYGLQERVRTAVGDMWSDPFPAADVHFYGDIFHDWRPEKCRELAEKSFASLESGGRIIVHEILYADDKAGPFPAAAFGITMLVWTEGQQFSGRELSALLSDVGFVDMKVVPTFGYWSIVTGRKP